MLKSIKRADIVPPFSCFQTWCCRLFTKFYWWITVSKHRGEILDDWMEVHAFDHYSKYRRSGLRLQVELTSVSRDYYQFKERTGNYFSTGFDRNGCKAFFLCPNAEIAKSHSLSIDLSYALCVLRARSSRSRSLRTLPRRDFLATLTVSEGSLRNKKSLLSFHTNLTSKGLIIEISSGI